MIDHIPRRERAGAADDDRARREPDHPDPGDRSNRKSSKTSFASSQPGSVRVHRREHAREHPERREFQGDAREHDAPARAEGPEHRAFVASLVPRRLDRRKQHRDARGEREEEDILDGERRAIDDVAYLA